MCGSACSTTNKLGRERKEKKYQKEMRKNLVGIKRCERCNIFDKFLCFFFKATLFELSFFSVLFMIQQQMEMRRFAYPLVVFVVFNFIGSVDMTNYARLNKISASQSNQSIWNCERTVNPAIRIHDAQWYLINDTIDWIANILARCDQQ